MNSFSSWLIEIIPSSVCVILFSMYVRLAIKHTNLKRDGNKLADLAKEANNQASGLLNDVRKMTDDIRFYKKQILEYQELKGRTSYLEEKIKSMQVLHEHYRKNIFDLEARYKEELRVLFESFKFSEN